MRLRGKIRLFRYHPYELINAMIVGMGLVIRVKLFCTQFLISFFDALVHAVSLLFSLVLTEYKWPYLIGTETYI